MYMMEPIAIHVDSVGVITHTDCWVSKRFCTSVSNYFSLSESAHTQHDESSTCLDISEGKVSNLIHLPDTTVYLWISPTLHAALRHLHHISHIFLWIHPVLRALAGHRCLHTASSSGGSLKHRRGRGAAALRVQRTQPGFSMGRHTGEAHSSNNKEKSSRFNFLAADLFLWMLVGSGPLPALSSLGLQQSRLFSA